MLFRQLAFRNDHVVLASVACCLAIAPRAQPQRPAGGAASRSRVVVAARQLGPVGYRDPLGVISPDGQWLAYTSDGRLRLTPVAGGPAKTLGPPSKVFSIVWL